jgi:hypothetical protein
LFAVLNDRDWLRGRAAPAGMFDKPAQCQAHGAIRAEKPASAQPVILRTALAEPRQIAILRGLRRSATPERPEVGRPWQAASSSRLSVAES